MLRSVPANPEPMIYKNNQEDNKPPTNSWLNTFATTACNLTSYTLNNIFFVSSALLQPVSAICFTDHASGLRYNNLNCLSPSLETHLYQLATNACHVTLGDLHCHAAHFDTTRLYGKGLIGGSKCNWKYSYHYNYPENACINAILSNNTSDGFGTGTDIILTIAASVVTLGAAAKAGLTLFKYYKQRKKMTEEHELDDFDEKFSLLQNEIENLSDEDNDQVKTLKNDITTFSQNAECPIYIGGIMKKPVTLTCGHNFEMAALEQSLESKMECPMCRDKVEHKDVKVNELMVSGIESKLTVFSQAAAQLKQNAEKAEIYTSYGPK